MIDLSYMLKDMETQKDRTEKRVNRFNGESVMLTKEEARIHDDIFMYELMATITAVGAKAPTATPHQ